MAGELRYRLCMCLLFLLNGVLVEVSAQPNALSENVALNKSCRLSTMYSDNKDPFLNKCGAANNGNTGTVYGDGNCIHTNVSDPHPEWTVYLGQDYVIHSITIFARASEIKRMSHVNVTINDIVVKTFLDCGSCGFSSAMVQLPLDPPVIGDTVTFEGPAHGGGDEPTHFLNICEVQVSAYVCTAGNYPYGSSCVPCGQCADGDCSNSTGHCSTDCSPGYTGLPFCHTECDDHHYGYNCSQNCSAGCAGETCDNVNGTCDNTTCLPGYFLTPLCDDECDRHHYGTNCSQRCSAGCEGDTCDGATGHCDVSTCRPGYLQSPMCDQACPNGTYGSNCNQVCGQGCLPAASCNNENGRCACLSDAWETGTCAVCARGHYDPNSGCENTCGIGCQEGTCNLHDGTCSCKDVTNWEAPYCRVQESSDGDSIIGPIVGSVVGVGVPLTITVIALAVVMWKRKSEPLQHPGRPLPKDISHGLAESSADLALPTGRPASTTQAARVIAAVQRDEDTEGHYDKIEDVTPARHGPQYYNTEGSSTGHYDQLAVQYENTGDVRPYQQWSVSRDGHHDNNTRTA